MIIIIFKIYFTVSEDGIEYKCIRGDDRLLMVPVVPNCNFNNISNNFDGSKISVSNFVLINSIL